MIGNRQTNLCVSSSTCYSFIGIVVNEDSSSPSRASSISLQLSFMFLPPAFLVCLKILSASLVFVLIILLYACQRCTLFYSAVGILLRCTTFAIIDCRCWWMVRWTYRLSEVVFARIFDGWSGSVFYHRCSTIDIDACAFAVVCAFHLHCSQRDRLLLAHFYVGNRGRRWVGVVESYLRDWVVVAAAGEGGRWRQDGRANSNSNTSTRASLRSSGERIC